MASPPSTTLNPLPTYQAYLVRIWLEEGNAPPRASAQLVGGGEPVRFATLPALFAYLEAQAATGAAMPDLTDAHPTES